MRRSLSGHIRANRWSSVRSRTDAATAVAARAR